jgi:hypothetical protein
MSESSDTEEIKVLEQSLRACLTLFGEQLIPLVEKLKAAQAFDKAYVPESLEKWSGWKLHLTPASPSCWRGSSG